ncbi:hypothetical protein CS063_03990 [Sporanaerobium hydrogeniformans]|uniref:Uncharacterized protein n=1 Tax=Sporanaerobium hydrogeniformans TaxID=3072179 RepID=A0AC61DFU6_9FIRM|nr:YHS domain-containing protein [Sporanaerobium hydrogeniformans]PHV71728.1 hypothetical protein CS063_03990 [Sporanaerobium hydrogeniformans]
MELVLNIFVVIMLVSLFNLIRYMLKIRKILKMNKDNPNIQGISIINGEIKVIEKIPTPSEITRELVVDPICGKEIEKTDAYRVMREGKEHFFCSWECRERFVKEHTLEGNE